MRGVSILAVGTYPRAHDLTWTALVMHHPIQVQIEKSPAKAFALIEENFYPVISFDDTDTFGISGIQFLKNCQKISPLSSRILYSSSLQKNKIKALVTKGTVTSYAVNPFDVNSVLSANIVALESYKINRLGSRLFALDFESIAGVDGALNGLSNIIDDIEFDNGSEALKVDFENRDAELNRLLLGAKAIEQTISLAKTSSQALLEKTGKTGVEDLKIKTNQIHRYLERIKTFAVGSENYLEKLIDQVTKANIAITSTREEIKQLKKEINVD